MTVVADVNLSVHMVSELPRITYFRAYPLPGEPTGGR